MLIDKRMIIAGAIMIIVGIVISWHLTETAPIGKTGMTEDEKMNLLLLERENSDYRLLSGILIGFGDFININQFWCKEET